ncbi:MAG: integrase core domain-containing protein [Bryobacteraceae bacterium]
MARKNPIWGEERIANELFLKLGIRVSPRTVRTYLGPMRPNSGASDQLWATFLRNHARAVVACDFFVCVTATFRILYVFMAMEIGSRRILHCHVTDHPTAEWTTQQFREVLADCHPYKFVVHDRDSIFSSLLDMTLEGFGLQVIKTPIRAPKANAYCERLIGTLRRECLDYVIPINQRHLRRTLKEFVCYYNRGRPHTSLGPGIPEPTQADVPASGHRHLLPAGYCVRSKPVLGGLHHDYRLEKEIA